MKAKKIILSAALLFSLAACEIEEPVSKRSEIVEGIPVTLAIPFKANADRIMTRAAQDEDLEKTVDNAYLFIFDEAGNKIGHRFCTTGDGMIRTTDSTGRLEINTTSQNKARIVGIANLNVGTVSTAYQITPAMLENIETYGQLCALQMKLSERSVQRGSTFVMTGFAKNSAGEEWVQIPGSESTVKELEGTLRFERTDAKIEFIVKSEAAQPSWNNFSFQPKEWRVCQIPAQSLVMKDETGADAEGSGTEYFSSRFVNFEKIDRVENNATLYEGGSFVFYMPENKKKPNAPIPVTDPQNPGETLTDAERYALRDRQEKIQLPEPVAGTGQSVENGDFVYANQNSTYVEMTGTLSYEYVGPNQTYYIESDVRYLIHLGYASGNPDDYNTERNTHYIYTVTVRGVDDIVVEVTNDTGDDEVRPGAEGDVIYSLDGVYEFDAHYDRRLITIPLSEIPDGQTDPNAANGVTWGIRTPFSNGIYDLNAPNNFSGIEDYKWVKFAINSDYGVNDDKYVKYPGDQNYDDPRIDDGTDNQPPGSSYGYNGDYSNAHLLDVQQFVKRINKMKAEGKNGNVAVTVFIDEYVYYRNPVTYDNDLSLWKYSVDQPDRMMYLFIVPGESKYSPDGESFVINSVLTFRQKSLRTVYNVDHPDLAQDPDQNDNYQGLWGLESIMETGRLETGGSSAIANGDSRSNGRRNTLRCMLGTDYSEELHWSDVLNTSDHYAINNTKYQNALYACLMRNRDLNGDNIVQANEIRWYLASVNQLVDIYIGEYALDREAWLYPENPADRDNETYWHYTTSTYNNGNPEVLWSEEGASLGSYGASQSSNGNLYAYRCVRNLGISIDKPDTEPLPLYTCTQTNGEYLIDATRLSVKSRRENFEAGYLPEHNDLSTSNLPYARFLVQGADRDFPTPEYKIEYYGPLDYGLEFTNEQTWEECLQYEDRGSLTAGYRLPNQREILIMLNILPDEAWRSYQESHWTGTKSKKAMYMCKTRFSRAGQDHFSSNRLSFRMNAQDKSIGLLNNAYSEGGYIRAVKDVRQ